MSHPFPGWVLDPTRNQYYYISEAEDAYIYHSGERIPLNGAERSSASQLDGSQQESGSRGSRRASERQVPQREQHDKLDQWGQVDGEQNVSDTEGKTRTWIDASLSTLMCGRGRI